MTLDEQIDSIIAESDRRLEILKADYDPVTGEGAPGKRVLLEIPDFAIPKQWVPKRMMKNHFIKELLRCKSIKNFLKLHPNDPEIKDEHDVEITLRKLRHKYDYYFWAYFCFPIISKTGGEVRFKLNKPQQIVDSVVEDKIEQKEPIDICIVKSRQWGGSTYSISKHTYILLKLDHYHSFVVAAHVQGAAENILRMLKHAISKYPAWDLGLDEDETLQLLPAGKSGNAYAIKDSKGNQVVPGLIYIGSAQYPDSLRSPAVMGAHYSEVGVWPNTPERRPEDLIATISGGILKRHLSMQIVESTAKMTDDFLHTLYTDSKNGKSSYIPMFIPWLLNPYDILPVKDKRAFVKELLEHKDDEQPYGRWKDSGKHYWWLWTLGCTIDGLNWYKYKRLDYTTYAQMANEAPSTDIEAFQAAGSHVFDVYEVEALRQYCKPPVKIGTLISDDRRDKGVVSNIRFMEKASGNLWIWEEPDGSPIKDRYIISVDIGGPNPTSDYHSVRVMDRMMMMPDFKGRPNIVAEMHYHCTRDDLVFDAVRLAKWYNNALLVIESNTLEMSDRNRNTEGDGSQYVLDMAAEIYNNLYFRQSDADSIREGTPTRWGFQTNAKTKPLIIDNMQWAIHERIWDEPNKLCLDEISMYIMDGNKMTAPAKKHDDILMSTAILLWVCFHEMPIPRWIEETPTQSRMEVAPNLATF